MQDQELFKALVVEAREHLLRVEPQLLELERVGGSVPPELINSIFRAVHSIKGGFSFFGQGHVVQLSHATETVLARVRSGKLEATPAVVDVLLRAFDKLRYLIEHVAEADSIAIEQEMEALRALGGESGTGDTTAASTLTPASETMPRRGAGAPPVPDERLPDDIPLELLLNAQRRGMHIYRIAVDSATDVRGKGMTWSELFARWQKYSEILSMRPSRQELEMVGLAGEPLVATVTVASVLEPDLLARALELPSSRFAILPVAVSAAQAAQGHSAGGGTKERPQQAFGGAGEGVLWVKVDVLDKLMNLAGELVLARNRLVQAVGLAVDGVGDRDQMVRRAAEIVEEMLAARGACGWSKADLSPADRAHLALRFRPLLYGGGGAADGLLKAATQKLDVVTTALQEMVLKTRLQPLSVVFRALPRILRDTARELGKRVTLVMDGQDVEVDRSIIEMLGDPLTHLVRNCVVHGIEMPETRRAAGKPESGTVWMRAYHREGSVVVEVQDDGGGIDPERIRQIALEKGVLDRAKAAGMGARELQALIFMPGFSTLADAGNFGGRGVGMDVVKTNVERLGGTVEVESEAGVGTIVSLRLPLTLAIMPSLVVTVEGRRFAIPQAVLEEIVRVGGDEIGARVERIACYEMLRLRERLLPLVRLATVVGVMPTYCDPRTRQAMPDRRMRWSDRRGTAGRQAAGADAVLRERRTGLGDRRRSLRNALRVVVLRQGSRRFGLVVDAVLDNEEIVVKPLPSLLAAACYSGAAIMGDGSVAMILEPGGIVEAAGLRFEEIEETTRGRERRSAEPQSAAEEEMLVFSAGGPERLAVALSALSRIEKRRSDEIEVVGRSELVRSGRVSMRLYRLEEYLPIGRPEKRGEWVFVVVPRQAPVPIGFCAAQIGDAVRTRLDVDSGGVRGPGVRGTAAIAGHITLVLDMPGLVNAVCGRTA